MAGTGSDGGGGGAPRGLVPKVGEGGGGLGVPEAIPPNEPVSVTMAFLDHAGTPTQEKLAGIVAWMAPSPKGFLIGSTWDQTIDPETHPALAAYVDPGPPARSARSDRAPAPPRRRAARGRR